MKRRFYTLQNFTSKDSRIFFCKEESSNSLCSWQNYPKLQILPRYNFWIRLKVRVRITYREQVYFWPTLIFQFRIHCLACLQNPIAMSYFILWKLKEKHQKCIDEIVTDCSSFHATHGLPIFVWNFRELRQSHPHTFSRFIKRFLSYNG